MPDRGGKTYEKFATGHIGLGATILADGRAGIKGGLKGKWKGPVQRKFDPSEHDACLSTARHAVSNSWACGTLHGLSITRMQSYADELSWGNSQPRRRRDDRAPQGLLRRELHKGGAPHVRVPSAAVPKKPKEKRDRLKKRHDQRL
ncbi:MAG: hypothetical protein Q4B54_07265 [Coriobacteriales bacterium]|nr:hypothetical protein [Coriobacteriales bacterium]